ncbi:expressed unknown protein [Seminavis robusta]|uniref:Uncharacterized protein n=1 Tax=Seminavis robusta TaxID=568900 RepID=A0A9N8ECH3_9STRA|nr:expressed unknown protein [Seminavis robusta]|eukprot:Sro878_g214730.1 n/a (700) ;mRNA; f:13730-16035
MTTFTSVRALFAFVLLFVSTNVAVNGEKVIRMSFRFAFEDEGLLAADRRPTQKEVEAVLCQANVFFSKSLQKKMSNSAIAVVTKEADFSFGDFLYEGDNSVLVEMPASINFTLEVSNIEGGTPPSLDDVEDSLPSFDYGNFLKKHVWKAAPVSKNFFFEARGVVWQSAIVDRVAGAIPVVDCPKGAKPESMAQKTIEGGPPKEVYNGTDYAAANGLTLKIGFYDTGEESSRAPTDMEWEALVCEVDRFLNHQLKESLKDDSIGSYATMIHWEYSQDEYMPAQMNFTLEAYFGNGTQVSNLEIFKVLALTDVQSAKFIGDYVAKSFPERFNIFAQVDRLVFRGASIRESEPETTLAKANCPVMVRSTDLANFEIKFEFEDDKKREPTRDEIEAMICEANKFFQKSIREGLKDPSIISYANNIDWTYNSVDQFSAVVTFTLLSLYGDGSHVRGNDIFTIMEGADVQFLTEKYILNAVPLEQNVFYFSKNLFFSGSLGKDIKASKIPNGVKCKKKDDRRMATFSIQIGYDSRTGVPTEQDVKGFICQNNLYFEKRLREKLKDKSINSHAINIDWSYIPGSDYPSVVNFTSFTTYGNGELIPGKQVYDIMAVIDVDDYVRHFIWNSEPYDINIFYDTRKVIFGGRVNGEVKQGKLDKVVCTPPGLASGSPNVTTASGPKSGEEATLRVESENSNHVSHLLPHS